jgi:hypothetical protein
MQYGLTLDGEQVKMLRELLELPQLTVPFAKAVAAGELYSAVKDAAALVTEDEKKKEATGQEDFRS